MEDESDQVSGDQRPEEVEIWEYEPEEIESSYRNYDALEDFIFELADRYGPWDVPFEITPAMIKANRDFVDAVLSEFKVFSCTHNGKKYRVKVSDYLD